LKKFSLEVNGRINLAADRDRGKDGRQMNFVADRLARGLDIFP